MSAVITEPAVRATAVAQPAPPKWLLLSAFAAVYVIWGSTYVGIHIAVETMPPLMMAGSRFFIAGVVLYAIVRLRGAGRPTAIHWRDAAVIGALLLVGGNGGVSWAQKSVPSGVTALIVAATPLWMNLIDWLRPGGRRPTPAVFAGLVLGFVGVTLIGLSRDQLGHRIVHPLGAIVLLLATLTWAFGSVFSRHARQPESPLLGIGMQMIAGGALLLGCGAATGEVSALHFATFSHASIVAFIYLTLAGSLIGFTAYVWLLQVSTPSRVSTYAYVNPLIAVLLGRLILAEPLPGSVLFAGTLIIVAVILIVLRKAPRRAR
jgi:drug/metabolite transporter (DMT)-like permease